MKIARIQHFTAALALLCTMTIGTSLRAQDGPIEAGEGFEVSWTLDAHDYPELFPRGPAFGARSVLAGMDFDGDGNKEFLFTTDETLAPQGPDPGFLDVFLYESTGDNEYEYVWHYTHTDASNSLPPIGWGDIDEDGLYEIYFGVPTIDNDPTDLFVFEQNEDLTFPETPTTTWDYARDGALDFRPAGFQIVDVDGDGRQELLTVSRTSGARELVVASPDAGIDAFTTWSIEFEAGNEILAGGGVYDVDVIDFDNDGNNEIWVNTWNLFSMSIFEVTGPDSYELSTDIDEAYPSEDHGSFNSHDFLFADVDGDGRDEYFFPTTSGALFFLDDLDDVSTITGASFDSVGYFLDPEASGIESRGADIGDIDDDGMIDLVISRGTGEDVIRLEYNGGDPRDFSSYDMSVIIAQTDPETAVRFYPLRITNDLDGDGMKEVIVTNLFGTDPGQPIIVIAEATGEATAVEAEPGIPNGYQLGQNYPNPFNPSTKIVFDVPETADIDVSVFDVTGTKVAALASGTVAAGSYEVTFDAEDLPSGVYLVRMQTPFGSLSRKAMLLK
jgi:hypothetical protein